MKTVLIIEDIKEYQDYYKNSLKNFDLFQALTLRDAINIYNDNKNTIDIIAFDTWLQEDNSFDFFKQVRGEFKWIIITTSNTLKWRKLYLENWADYEIKDKLDLVEFIVDLSIYWID
ncbi:MAG: hypothetical protein ACD_4C00138G0009 [uncultured bacterium (gcode 4)]|uniref:Response regulatory domain-containing protein n=1 Tax=uncultured bacterium (gcode 4) TaxID=1234023 RepID=K2GTZ1_9BACT|nr:MAG: hypothetical protein ACD_4C00138G0009 [uncultured bacterium (gcode 4)]